MKKKHFIFYEKAKHFFMTFMVHMFLYHSANESPQVPAARFENCNLVGGEILLPRGGRKSIFFIAWQLLLTMVESSKSVHGPLFGRTVLI